MEQWYNASIGGINMTHYKVAQTADPALDGFRITFCGKNVAPPSRDFLDQIHHIPPCDTDCSLLVVDCPICLAVMEVIKAHTRRQDRLIKQLRKEYGLGPDE
jgi:hypothetical protein